VKRPVKRVHRSIDDAAVEPKQKTAQGRDRGNRNDIKSAARHAVRSFRD
jgi:hypothetical protein